MWLATTRGFYSAVAHRNIPDLVLVRARTRADMQRLVELAQEAPDLRPGPSGITETFDADYPYRVSMDRWVWAMLAQRLAAEIDYPNFKDAVKARVGGQRARTYTEVWCAMQDAEDEDPQLLALTPYQPEGPA